MASDLLTQCPACQGDVSRLAPTCPRCGHPIAAPVGPQPDPPSVDPGPQSGIGYLFSFRGRATRSYLWKIFIAGTGIGLCLAALATLGDGTAVEYVAVATLLSLTLVSLAVGPATWVKRLHDIDQSGWLALLLIVPIVNIGFVIWAGSTPGKDGENRFGPPPPSDPIPQLESLLGWVILAALISVGVIVLSEDATSPPRMTTSAASATNTTVPRSTTTVPATTTTTSEFTPIVPLVDRGARSTSAAVSADPGFPAFDHCQDSSWGSVPLCNTLAYISGDLEAPNFYQKINDVDPSELDEVFCDGFKAATSSVRAGMDTWGDPWDELMGGEYHPLGQCSPSLTSFRTLGIVPLPDRWGWPDPPEDEVVAVWCLGAAQGIYQALEPRLDITFGETLRTVIASDCAARA